MIVWKTWSAFLLLIPLALILGWMWVQKNQRRTALQVSTLRWLKDLRPTLRARLRWVPLALQVLALVLAIIALARPQRADTKVRRSVEGIDIMIALDVSDSMLIEDMQPVNRLVSSKKVIKEFIERRVSDRIGLVIFSGESYTRVPLTLDYPLLLDNLEAVQTTRNIKMGTAIGVSLANSVARLRESKAKTKIVILLTDGENNSGTIDPETALQIAKGYGIRIYSIGMGRDGQAQLPVFSRDAFGRTIKRYQPIHSKINEELLGRFASETGGRFYRATDTKGLEAVFEDINRLEKTKIDVSEYTRYAELFPPWLKISVLIYILSIILQTTLLRRQP